ncbi:MAG: hypothetical protein CSA26_01150 [Desulfobacterales bacterium]|nr:MAG: hypothetical protein CSA26_01150 [Desulfobacterales bacterium]
MLFKKKKIIWEICFRYASLAYWTCLFNILQKYLRGAGLLFVDSSQESTGTGYAKNAICFVFFDHDRETVNFKVGGKRNSC